MVVQKNPPGPKGWPIAGVIFELWRDPFRFLMETVRDYGPVASFRAGPDPFFLLSHPDDYQQVLQQPQRFAKQTQSYRFLRPLLGQGLLTSEGGFWRRQRRIAQPSFHRQRITQFARVIVQATQEMLEGWGSLEVGSTALDLSSEMMQLTYTIVSRALFSRPPEEGSMRIGEALRQVLYDAERRAHSVWSLPLGLPTPRNLRVRRALLRLNETAMGIIEGRRRDPDPPHDLLSMLMQARDEETGEGMSDDQLLDEVITILMAGHETTANALCWTWSLLATHPEVASRLNAELWEVLQGRPPTWEDFPRLAYAGRILEEALRLYPPVWWLDRRVMEDVEIGGYQIPKGSVVLISPYVMHHHADYWDCPEKFDPDRFLPEASAKRHPFCYLPFSHGPRQCIGNNFALLEARLILATVAQRYRLKLLPGHPVEKDPSIVLRPKFGIKVTLEKI